MHPLSDQLKQTLLDLCQQIEAQKPQNLDALYIFTHVATEHINILQDAFDEAESEIETVARESIGSDIYFIAQSYGLVTGLMICAVFFCLAGLMMFALPNIDGKKDKSAALHNAELQEGN